MTEAEKIGSRGALLVLAVTGLLTLLLSFGTLGLLSDDAVWRDPNGDLGVFRA